MLQADSEPMYSAWVWALQQAIGSAIQSGSSENSHGSSNELTLVRNLDDTKKLSPNNNNPRKGR